MLSSRVIKNHQQIPYTPIGLLKNIAMYLVLFLGSSRGSVDSGSVDSACSSWLMGGGFDPDSDHWWCQERHPTTIAHMFQRQISPKPRSEKSPIQGF